MIWIALTLYVLGAIATALMLWLTVEIEGSDLAFIPFFASIWPAYILLLIIMISWSCVLHNPETNEWRWRRKRNRKQLHIDPQEAAEFYCRHHPKNHTTPQGE